MQFSFVFITALVAAVSANPLPQAAQTPATNRFFESVPAGGPGGTSFSEISGLKKLIDIPVIRGIGGQAAVAIHAIWMIVEPDFPGGNMMPNSYGGDDGVRSYLYLDHGEFLNYMEIETDDWVTERDGDTVVSSVKLVHFVKVGTNLGNWRMLGTSKPGRQMTPYHPPPGYTQIVGLLGRYSTVIDQLGPIWA